jgi:hypothetical protein
MAQLILSSFLCFVLFQNFLVTSIASSDCTLFNVIPGLDVEPQFAVYVTPSQNQWNVSMCPTVHPNSVMIMPTTVAVGSAMCDLTSNSYPWAGIAWNDSKGIWVWNDGTNVSAKSPVWTYSEGSNPAPRTDCYQSVCQNGTCGQISCADSDKGHLFMGRCNKNQQIVCQVKRKFTLYCNRF